MKKAVEQSFLIIVAIVFGGLMSKATDLLFIDFNNPLNWLRFLITFASI